MSNNYTQPTLTGYNDTPPPDDGTVSEANRIKWATILAKFSTPVKTFIDTISANMLAAFNQHEAGRTLITSYTTAGADTHTFQTWCNKAWVICVGAGAQGSDYNVPINGNGGNSGSVAVAMFSNIKDVVGTATLSIGDGNGTVFERDTTYSDSESNAVTAIGATQSSGDGTPVGSTTNADSEFLLFGSQGGAGTTGRVGDGAVTFLSSGAGGVGGTSGSTTGANGGNGEVLIIEYE